MERTEIHYIAKFDKNITGPEFIELESVIDELIHIEKVATKLDNRRIINIKFHDTSCKLEKYAKKNLYHVKTKGT